jgi:hypothetical protein
MSKPAPKQKRKQKPAAKLPQATTKKMRLFFATLGLPKDGTKAELMRRFPGRTLRGLLNNSNVHIPSRATKADLIDLLLADPARPSADSKLSNGKNAPDFVSSAAQSELELKPKSAPDFVSIAAQSELGLKPKLEMEPKLETVGSAVVGGEMSTLDEADGASLPKKQTKKGGRRKGKSPSWNFKLPGGWTVIRKKNAKTGKDYVANYVSPAPAEKRFRSLVEVMRHLGVLPKEYDAVEEERASSQKADVYKAMSPEETAKAKAAEKAKAEAEAVAEAKRAHDSLKEANEAAKIAQQKATEHFLHYTNRGFRIEEVYLDIGPAGEKQVYVCPEKLSKTRKDASLSGL